jgi:hypothetical protein
LKKRQLRGFKYRADRDTKQTEAIKLDRTYRGRFRDIERYQPISNRGKSESGRSWDSHDGREGVIRQFPVGGNEA